MKSNDYYLFTENGEDFELVEKKTKRIVMMFSKDFKDVIEKMSTREIKHFISNIIKGGHYSFLN